MRHYSTVLVDSLFVLGLFSMFYFFFSEGFLLCVLCFFVSQAVECLLQQTSASVAEREVTGVQVAGGSVTVLDSGITEAQPDLAQAVHLESNPADHARRATVNYLNMMMRLDVSKISLR